MQMKIRIQHENKSIYLEVPDEDFTLMIEADYEDRLSCRGQRNRDPALSTGDNWTNVSTSRSTITGTNFTGIEVCQRNHSARMTKRLMKPTI